MSYTDKESLLALGQIDPELKAVCLISKTVPFLTETLSSFSNRPIFLPSTTPTSRGSRP
jgi:hypothetical protein